MQNKHIPLFKNDKISIKRVNIIMGFIITQCYCENNNIFTPAILLTYTVCVLEINSIGLNLNLILDIFVHFI